MYSNSSIELERCTHAALYAPSKPNCVSASSITLGSRYIDAIDARTRMPTPSRPAGTATNPSCGCATSDASCASDEGSCRSTTSDASYADPLDGGTTPRPASEDLPPAELRIGITTAAPAIAMTT